MTTVLAARSITEEEKHALMEKFGDESVSDEELKAMLDTLCDREIALRDAENAELVALRGENNADSTAEEARIAPEVARIEAKALADEQKVADEYVKDVGRLDGNFDKIEEAIKKNTDEADEMKKIRGSLGITGEGE